MVAAISVKVDPDIYDKFKRVVGAGLVSERLREYMINVIKVEEGDINEADIQILNKEIEDYSKQISIAQANLRQRVERRNRINEIKEAKELQKLEAEKAEIEKQRHCIQCGIILTDDEIKNYHFKLGSVCRPCYFGADSASIEKCNLRA